MNFAFSDEQRMLQDTVRSYLDSKAGSDRVRALMETDEGFDPDQWSELAEMGWQAMAIPEEYGGAGFTFLELGIILEELGGALLPAPFLSTVVLGATALLEGGSEEQKQQYLPRVAAGEHRLALAHVEASGRWDLDGIQMAAAEEGDGFVLTGEKSFVVDGHTADTLIVAARRADGSLGLFLVPGDAAGVTRSRLETMDMTRKQANVALADVRVPAAALLPGDGSAVLTRVFDLAAVALAAEMVGGAQRCLDASVEYAKVRYQFGRPIGSFQAIKHKCADMLLKVESARSAAYYAGWAASADAAELAVVAPLAKAYCAEAFFFCASENIQVHGGIGFTWEHDAHLYFKRAKSSALLLGDPAHHREILADRIGL